MHGASLICDVFRSCEFDRGSWHGDALNTPFAAIALNFGAGPNYLLPLWTNFPKQLPQIVVLCFQPRVLFRIGAMHLAPDPDAHANHADAFDFDTFL